MIPSEQSGWLRAIGALHLAVLLFGLAGVLGKMSGLPALELVLYRTLLGGVALGAFVLLEPEEKTEDANAGATTFLWLCGTGIGLAIHWYTFFQSIQISSVAVGLLSFSTFPVFAALFEASINRTKIRPSDLAASGLILSGLVLVVHPFHTSAHVTAGAIVGVSSGITFALLSIVNRRLGQTMKPMRIAFHQNCWACLCTALYLAMKHDVVNALNLSQLLLVAILGVGCTAVAHTMFVRALKVVRVATASIVATLEPVYGVVFAMLLLGEIPSFRIIVGGVVVLSTAAWASLDR